MDSFVFVRRKESMRARATIHFWATFGILFIVAMLPLTARSAPWRDVVSDQRPDPQAYWGQLPNGLRFVILPNEEPQDRVSLRFLVAAGSLLEKDEECGVAHFVEHMAFRGTKSHPDDTLTKSLERLGMAMGPDNTAFTYDDHTIYQLELPKPNLDRLRQCLATFREYAEEITFDPNLIERERGVVLSEKATRGKPEYYMGLANSEFLWPNNRQNARVPIGKEDIIKSCTRETMKGFYDAWYRPERMAVIVVGKVDPDATRKLISEVFGSLLPRVPARDEPPGLIASTASDPDIRVYSDPAFPGVSLCFEHPFPNPYGPDTAAKRKDNLCQALAFSMFQNRLLKYSKQFPESFVSPSSYVDFSWSGWKRAVITASAKITTWQRAASDLEQEHRRAFLQGFTPDELKIAKSAYINYYEEVVRTRDSRPSEYLAGGLVASFLYGALFSTPEDVRTDAIQLLESVTPTECTSSFRASWSSKPPHVFFIKQPEFPVENKAVAEVLNLSRTHKAENLLGQTATEFAYNDFGAAGHLVHSTRLPDLDVTLSEFDNGIRLNFKQTTFTKDWVQVKVRIGSGKLSQPEQAPGLDILAALSVMNGGLHKHSALEIRDLFAAKSASVQFGIESDACVFSAFCARRDLLSGLQLIAAYMTDAAYDPEVMREVRGSYTSLESSLASSPGGPLMRHAERILANGDRRFGIPEMDDLLSRDLTELKEWLEPQFKSGAVEIAVVGDVSWDDAQKSVATTLGALPARRPRESLNGNRQIQLPKNHPVSYTFQTDPTLNQIGMAWLWSLPDVKDTHASRRYRVLAALMAERLFQRLRSELGATYAPTVNFSERNGFDALSYLMAYAELLPNQVTNANRIVREEAANLRKGDVKEDEFNRIKQPILHALDDEVRTNEYWVATVLSDAQQRPFRLQNARDRKGDYESMQLSEVVALAKQSLGPNQSVLLVSGPSVTSGQVTARSKP